LSYGTITVTDSATQIVGPNPQRMGLIISNTGTVTIYLGHDTNVTSANGIPLLKNGTLSEDSGGEKMYQGPFYAITASSTSDVRYDERTR
jgi:hypothetical protein